MCAQSLSHVLLFVTLWTVACWAPLSVGFSSGLPCPPLGDLPNIGINTRCPTLQADSLPSKPPGKPQNTGVSSLSLLQGIIVTQELNQSLGLLHCRQVLSSRATREALFIIGDWNTKVGSQEIPGVTGKFGLGVQNEAGQRLMEFCQEYALVIANALYQQHKG